MTRLLRWIAFFLLGAFGCDDQPQTSSSAPPVAPSTEQPPNVIIILTDDQGYADVGFNGATDILTPHLDRLAGEGVIFSQGYVSHPYCSPSRAGLLTGRYQARFGHDCNPPYRENDATVGTPSSEVLIPEILKSRGYQSAAIGKWHLGEHETMLPPQQGFDHWFGFAGGSRTFWPEETEDYKAIYRNDRKVPLEELSYLTDDFTDEAIDFIQANQTNPFFIYLAYNAPHAPDHATRAYLDMTQHIEYGGRSVYAAMVAGVDVGVGKIDSTLTALGIKDNTMLIFLSDNGGRTEHADNRPYRGHKGMIFEGGIRVPFFISWPSGLKGGQTYEEPIIALDLLPTITRAAGATTDNELDGVNLLPFLSGDNRNSPHDILFWRAVGGFEYAVRKGPYKLYKSSYKDRDLLFDMETDPYERQDIASNHPEIVSALKADYDQWNAQMMEPGWVDPHPENVIKEEKRLQATRSKATREPASDQ